jgi:thioredoxin 1
MDISHKLIHPIQKHPATTRGNYMASQNILEITDANFEEQVLNSDVPVLVDFWAPWCGPCRTIGPIMEQLAVQYAGRLKVGKVNVDDNQQVASRLGISSIPAVFLFKGGDRVDEKIGAMPKSMYEAMVDRHL